MNIIKRYKLYKEYRTILKPLKRELLENYNVHMDNLYRLYTVVNIDPDEHKAYGGERVYNYTNEDIKRYLEDSTSSEKMITGDDILDIRTNKLKRRVENYLNSHNLYELFKESASYKVNKYNIAVVWEYRYINMKVFFNSIIFFSGGAFMVGLLFLIFLLLKNLFI